jgi:hypothetical protein
MIMMYDATPALPPVYTLLVMVPQRRWSLFALVPTHRPTGEGA